jgi:hypothetical protein
MQCHKTGGFFYLIFIKATSQDEPMRMGIPQVPAPEVTTTWGEDAFLR